MARVGVNYAVKREHGCAVAGCHCEQRRLSVQCVDAENIVFTRSWLEGPIKRDFCAHRQPLRRVQASKELADLVFPDGHLVKNLELPDGRRVGAVPLPTEEMWFVVPKPPEEMRVETERVWATLYNRDTGERKTCIFNTWEQKLELGEADISGSPEFLQSVSLVVSPRIEEVDEDEPTKTADQEEVDEDTHTLRRLFHGTSCPDVIAIGGFHSRFFDERAFDGFGVYLSPSFTYAEGYSWEGGTLVCDVDLSSVIKNDCGAQGYHRRTGAISYHGMDAVSAGDNEVIVANAAKIRTVRYIIWHKIPDHLTNA
eukprot:NODE_206_length_1199_cov_728.835652_g165_i0.p1 GENE.NODE_206_length_1199_cov_728.835652_g165_i0~~NODE_206_length_1199_cov_728.835652_g165_i0.p1  ORF type:complete len:312 (-),score=47.08 NODE_206_length_1199_cov_728.835652_g165_i0:88-1023(-)